MTNPQGRYAMKVRSEHAYIVAAHLGGRWAAPYRAGIVVRAGKPVEDLDLVVGQATRLHGRITYTENDRPASRIDVDLEITMGEIPPELRRPNDRSPHPLRMEINRMTDDEGRYDFVLGPGEHQLKTRLGTEPVKITVPATNPPAEIVRDLRVPRPEARR
jgi:hypothetical protein